MLHGREHAAGPARVPERAAVRASARALPLAKARRVATPWLFMLPALLIYLGFLVYPVVSSLALSLLRWDGLSADRAFVGLGNYQEILFNDPVARIALRNNIVWMVATVLIPTALGLLLAVALNQKLPGRNFFRSAIYAPGVLPLVAVGLIWSWLYNPTFGLVNQVLEWVGLGRFASGWLGSPETALGAVIVTGIWQRTGFPMLLYLAGLQAIPNEQYEAARIDGAGRWETFRAITLPWLRPMHVIVVALGVIEAVKVFDLIYSMTNGGPAWSTQTLATWMYFNMFQYFNIGYGSALAWVIAVISIAFAIPYIRSMVRR
jgi:raffinose/stachyose/melibiose transport system permease protein